MRQHNLKDNDVNDWYGTCAIGICKAALIYDGNIGGFTTLAYACMNTEVYHILRKDKTRIKTISLDETIGDEGTYYDIINNAIDNEPLMDKKYEIHNSINTAFTKLSKRQQEIVSMVVDDYKSMAEVSRQYNLSKQRIHQIMNKFRDLVTKELCIKEENLSN